MDLSQLTIPELTVLVADEIKRRRSSAIAELEAIAAKHGLSLAGLRIQSLHKSKTRRPRGSVAETALQMLRDGRTVSEVTSFFGYKNSGPIYVIAKKAGHRIVNGKMV